MRVRARAAGAVVAHAADPCCRIPPQLREADVLCRADIRAQIADAYANRVEKYDSYLASFQVRLRCCCLRAVPQACSPRHRPAPARGCEPTRSAVPQKLLATSGVPRAHDFEGAKKFAKQRADILRQVHTLHPPSHTRRYKHTHLHAYSGAAWCSARHQY